MIYNEPHLALRPEYKFDNIIDDLTMRIVMQYHSNYNLILFDLSAVSQHDMTIRSVVQHHSSYALILCLSCSTNIFALMLYCFMQYHNIFALML